MLYQFYNVDQLNLEYRRMSVLVWFSYYKLLKFLEANMLQVQRWVLDSDNVDLIILVHTVTALPTVWSYNGDLMNLKLFMKCKILLSISKLYSNFIS